MVFTELSADDTWLLPKINSEYKAFPTTEYALKCIHKKLLLTGTDFFRGDKNVLKLDMVLVVQLHNYTKSQWIVHIKWENFMVRKLYLHKGV